jgi:Ti-type conjugative transfer relaxase TraA
MIPRIKVGKGVTGAVRYVLGEGRDPETMRPRKQPANDQTRVAWVGGINVGFAIEDQDDVDLARRIMEFDAQNQLSRTKRCEYDCVHLSLGWRPGQEPTREQMEEAAQAALKSLGMENAKAIFAAHNDEDYFHLHIVASKINPETGRAYDLKQSHMKLSRWAERYERENGGIVCTRREEANQLRDAIDRRDAGAVLELMTEQRSTFTGKNLERVLDKQIFGQLERAQFAEKILTHADAVRLSDQADGKTTRYSTRQVIETEQHTLRAADGLARSDRHQVGAQILAAVASEKKFDGISREQIAAYRHATGGEGIAVIDGQAGTGKSFTMTAIREAYEAQGYKAVGLAPTNAVAQDMQRDGFSSARTVHSELFSLNNDRTQWDQKTVVMVDESAMIDTRNMAMLTAHAHAAGAKLILVGDDRQLSSIERGGMFGVMKDRYGAAELASVRRQHKNDDRRASELMAEGNFHTALEIYEAKGAIKWTRTQPEARAALVAQWTKDSAAEPDKSRFVFAYTNADVDQLNRAIRGVRKERGELEHEDHNLDTKHGRAAFSGGDRIQFTGTDKAKGLFNGQAGTVRAIDGSKVTVELDGRGRRSIEFDAAEFKDFRHGYAGTIYKGQGRTLDQTYLYHSEHWRSAASYVALTRHRDKAAMFVATNTAPDLKQLARQMARVDDRRAASHFHQLGDRDPIRPLTPRELAERFNDPALRRRFERQDVTRRQQEESDRRQSAEPTAIAARAANDPGREPAADKVKPDKRYKNRYTKSDRPSDRERSDGNDRGGRGGRTR